VFSIGVLRHNLALRDHRVQRLFSIFPNGWPGRGLLILRLAVGGILLTNGVAWLASRPHSAPNAPAIIVIGLAAGLLMLVGLWTPVASGLAVISQSWALLVADVSPETAILLLSISLAIAMLGPGAWSIDARLFGRHRLDITD
jgi:putative oxidoreductase